MHWRFGKPDVRAAAEDPGTAVPRPARNQDPIPVSSRQTYAKVMSHPLESWVIQWNPEATVTCANDRLRNILPEFRGIERDWE